MSPETLIRPGLPPPTFHIRKKEPQIPTGRRFPPDDIIKNKIIAAGLQVSCYVQFHLPKEEVEMAKQSNGFVYLQAKPYDTQQKNEEYPTLKDCVEYLRSCGIERPIYCGVGVHAPEDVRLVREAGGDAAFVGSTILKLHENIPAMKEKIREFKAMC